MDQHGRSVSVEVVEAGLLARKDEVGLKADHVVEEAAELVKLALDLDVRARVFLQVELVLRDGALEIFSLILKTLQRIPQLEHLEEIALA